MNPVGIFFFGMFCGGAVITVLASLVMRDQDRFYNSRLDYWASHCTDLTAQVNALLERLKHERDSGDWWKDN